MAFLVVLSSEGYPIFDFWSLREEGYFFPLDVVKWGQPHSYSNGGEDFGFGL